MIVPRPTSLLLLLPYLLFLFFFFSHSSATASGLDAVLNPGNSNGVGVFNPSSEARTSGGNLAEPNATSNSSLILAKNRTLRKDPFADLKPYAGGWNISNQHYWASVALTAGPLFIIAIVWFLLFGICLLITCISHCCCRRKPYGYSRTAYALSLAFLMFFTISAIVGCTVLYVGQRKFHDRTTRTLEFIVDQANETAENLKNLSMSLSAAKSIAVDSIYMAARAQKEIDEIDAKISSAASILTDAANNNAGTIQRGLDGMGLALMILSSVMLLLAFIGFLCSIFGLQGIVYTLVVFGWILVTVTFVLCGVFLLLHNVVGDTCVAMDDWLQNPTAQTALDDILPCVDNATAKEIQLQSKTVNVQIASMVNGLIYKLANANPTPDLTPPFNYNQSGPLVPYLCSPFNPDLTDRFCTLEEVELGKAAEVWKNLTCQTSSFGICATTGRLTPMFYTQMVAAVNVSYGLYRYGPFLVELVDCTFVRQVFTDIRNNHCPGLGQYTQWIYVGLLMVSAAVMMSLVFWVIYARERRHRVYTNRFISGAPG